MMANSVVWQGQAIGTGAEKNAPKSGVVEESMNQKVKAARMFCENNKPMLMKDDKCGCFYCLEIFNPSEIKEWIPDTKGTAICPFCGVDSIISESYGHPISKEFLSEMKQYRFDR